MNTHENHLVKLTADGTPTIQSSLYDTEFHSMHGALTESLYVYLEKGLLHYLNVNPQPQIKVLEYGFGTGLNALLTAEAAHENLSIQYHSLELFPLSEDIYRNYGELLWKKDDLPYSKELFLKLHEADWEKDVAISPHFTLFKQKCDFKAYQPESTFDVVFYDAFGPGTQPELWGEEIFKKIFLAMKSGGVLTTFCVQGAFRRMLSSLGFKWEKLPGPPGKREMLRVFRE